MTHCQPTSGAPAARLFALAVAAVLAVGIAGIPAGAGPVATPSQRYILPSGGTGAGATRAELLSSGALVRDFEPPSVRWGPGHRGVDLRSETGSPVLAPQAGTVSFVGVVVDRPLVVISHPDGLRSTLEPVTSELTTGAPVARGEVVGTLAAGVATHCDPATCLHWGVRRGEEYIDPLTLVVETEPVILLPVAPR